MQILDSQLQPDPLLTAREVGAMLAISLPSVFRHVAEGKLPKPIKLGASSRWPQSEILAVIEAAKVARESAK
ncbi:helix-turn-helix transcriptional regulator [Pontibaca methylaminivorans]|uniref:Transcriptional regulator, AlpA family n=1 Tax=Pontibaca methylaminivorans TaxID=515897 RepID=A0A1R3WA69_9RHOB|nr:helix-turn-helix domain-containing protein [Pontibaca methylaminivorans]SIT74890.1 transcriptional regulator, AlpA family [Pontibaca methylaminivorans]